MSVSPFAPAGASATTILPPASIRASSSSWVAERSHAGVILVYGIDHREFGVLVRGIERCVEMYPQPATWRDLAVVINHEFASGS